MLQCRVRGEMGVEIGEGLCEWGLEGKAVFEGERERERERERESQGSRSQSNWIHLQIYKLQAPLYNSTKISQNIQFMIEVVRNT